MSLSSDLEDNRKKHIKRQSANSPLAVLSPSVRPQSTKLSRLSGTPLGRKLAYINQIDPNIDATLLELYSVEKDRVPTVINPDPNIEQSLVEETLQSEETTKEAMGERSIASECDDITDVTSSSVAAALSPGMSNEMKSAIKTYLKSTSMYSTSLLESKAELLNVVGDVAGVGKNEDTEELNISVSTRGSQEKVVGNNSIDSVKIDLSVSGSKFSAGTTETNSCSGILCETIDMNNVIEAQFTEATRSPVLQVESAEKVPLLKVSSMTPKCLTTQVDKRMASPDMLENLTLSARKNRVFATRNLNLDNLSSPRELASYAEERAQNYSFLINEAYCETSMFCENCYAMRIELGLLSDKFAALTATIGGLAAEGNIAFVAELENLLRGKEAEIVALSSKLRDLTQSNDQLSRQKEIAEKDSEDYRFFFKDEVKKKLGEIDILQKKLYEAEHLIYELEQEKPKQPSKENTSQTDVEFDTSLIEIMQQQLDTAHSLHQKAQQRIEELENKLQKIVEEKSQLSLKLQELESENSDGIISDENKHVSIISLLEARVAELGNKIDEAVRINNDETMVQKSFLLEKVTSVLEKIKGDVKSNVFANKWDADDVEISVTYFEKAVNIICQDIPQFETLVETVAQYGKLARNEFKQLEMIVEKVVEEKNKWEMLFTSEKSKLDSLQEVMLTQFSENKNCFSSLLQDFQNKCTDTLCSVTEFTKTKSEENQNCGMLKMLRHIEDLQEKLNGKWSKDSDEMHSCLKEQHFIVTSFQAEMQEMSNKMKILHESVEKDFKNLSVLLDSFQGREAKQLGHNERETDTFKQICEHGEEIIQACFFREFLIDLKKSVQHLQKVEEDIRSQNTALHKNLDFGSGNFAPIIHVTENLTREKDKLENENAALRSTIFILEKENIDLKEMREISTVQEKKVQELEHRLNLLQKENERLGKACDDADEEVGDLKEQIFELLRVNAKLQAEMHGEDEEAVNRRMGYIEPPAILPGIHLSAHGTSSGVNLPNAKIEDVTENLLKSKLDVNVKDVVIEKTVEERKEIQKLMGKENVLAEAAKALVKSKSFVESAKSKTTRDQSCRTS
ncbi:unnamed protein product [Wuchereria bancrofti]|uniref:Uncharacterized protein n=2 Tax=Wuchereria bancrofti TaxID=6293 RepID=A0A3P7FB15_WUCBA|nr:unnamed protein product [Wuchereria bancrofti]